MGAEKKEDVNYVCRKKKMGVFRTAIYLYHL